MPTPGSKRLVFMACSKAKRTVSDGGAMAGKVYDGPLWQTLARSRAEAERRRLEPPFALVLSAQYGFISEAERIASYDALLTKAQGQIYLTSEAQMRGLRRMLGEADTIHLAGGVTYTDCMRQALLRVQFRGTISCPVQPRGIGDHRAALSAFVLASPLSVPHAQRA